MELNFRLSNIASYSLIEMDGKRYIMDLNSMEGKRYYMGFLPEEVTVYMTELDKKNNSFTIKNSPNVATTAMVIIVQPFVRYTYDLMQKFFVSGDISQQIGLKLAMFAFSMFLSFLISVFYIKSSKRKADSRIPENSKRYKLTFKPNGKRMHGSMFTVFNFICLAFFMYINDGSEGVLLIINGIIAFFVFLFFQMPTISTAYRNKELILEKIEEI